MAPDLRYPVGPFEPVSTLTPDQRRAAIDAIAEVPTRLRAAVANLTDAQLDTPYRPGGWTVRQLVHHIADSHMNALTRFKLALTENEPMIKTYEEQLGLNSPTRKLRRSNGRSPCWKIFTSAG